MIVIFNYVLTGFSIQRSSFQLWKKYTKASLKNPTHMVQFDVIGATWTLYFAREGTDSTSRVAPDCFLIIQDWAWARASLLSAPHIIMPPPPPGTILMLPAPFSRFTHLCCKIPFLPDTLLGVNTSLSTWTVLLLATDTVQYIPLWFAQTGAKKKMKMRSVDRV